MSTDSPPIEEFVSSEHESAIAERIAVGWRTVVFCAVVAMLFVYFDNLRIYHTDIWGHVSYGEWMLEHGRLPTEEPLLDLAEGVPIVASAWLSQVIFALVYDAGGAHWISHIFGLSMTAVAVLFAVGLWLRTGSSMWGLAGVFAIFLLAPTRIAVVRPETFGTLMFAAVMLGTVWAETRLRSGVTPWVTCGLVTLLMAVWANLHGSYVVGIAVIGAHVAGRFLEAWGHGAVEARQSSEGNAIVAGLVAALRDPGFRFWLVTTELAIAATLLNPYGVDLLVNAFVFPSNPNLEEVLEWKPLPLISVEGITFSASWIALVVIARFSRARFRVHEILLLAVLNLAVIKGVRMISWYAAVYVFALAPHAVDVWARARDWYRLHWSRPAPPRVAIETTDPDDEDESPSLFELVRRRTVVHTAVAALILWWGFAFSPMGNVVLGGTPRTEERLYHLWTPRAVGEFLQEHETDGRVFEPQWWGDWLVREAPNHRYFMTTNAVHVVTPTVWEDYLRVARGGTGWEEVLRRYEVSTVVVHEEAQRGLARRLRASTDWRLIYEDDLAIVYERKSSAGSDDDTNPSGEET